MEREGKMMRHLLEREREREGAAEGHELLPRKLK